MAGLLDIQNIYRSLLDAAAAEPRGSVFDEDESITRRAVRSMAQSLQAAENFGRMIPAYATALGDYEHLGGLLMSQAALDDVMRYSPEEKLKISQGLLADQEARKYSTLKKDEERRNTFFPMAEQTQEVFGGSMDKPGGLLAAFATGADPMDLIRLAGSKGLLAMPWLAHGSSGIKPTTSGVDVAQDLGEAAGLLNMPVGDALTSSARVKAGDTVSGLTVGSDVPNTGSIRATFDDFEDLGVRAIPMVDPGIKSTDPDIIELAEQIKRSGRIDPLIIAIDDTGASDFVLEGSHRIEALRHLGVDEFPALLVKGRKPTTSGKGLLGGSTTSGVGRGFTDKTTDMPFFDDMMKDPDYFRAQKGLEHEIIEMTPTEYFQRIGREKTNNSIDPKLVNEYADKMRQGEQFPMGTIELHGGRISQEGQHRALAAEKAFGQDTKMPVMVVKRTEEEMDLARKAYNEKEKEIIKWLDAQKGAPTTSGVGATKTALREAVVSDNATELQHCYDNSFRVILNTIDTVPDDNLNLVHGTVTNAEGKSFPHAWVEMKVNDEWMAIDAGRNPDDPIKMGRDKFRETLNAKDITEYPPEKALVTGARAGHYGPWDTKN